MLQIYKSLPNFKGESSLSTWAYRITLNTCLKNYRVDKGVKFYSLEDYESKLFFKSKVDTSLDFKTMLEYASTFNVMDRELIILYITGVDQNEISSNLGISVSSVSMKALKATIQKM